MQLMNKILNELFGEDIMSADMGNEVEHDMEDYEFGTDDGMPKKHKKGCACNKGGEMGGEIDDEIDDEGFRGITSVGPEY